MRDEDVERFADYLHEQHENVQWSHLVVPDTVESAQRREYINRSHLAIRLLMVIQRRKSAAMYYMARALMPWTRN